MPSDVITTLVPNVVSVADYRTGQVDDGIALRNAVDALPNGGVLYITVPLNVQSNVTIPSSITTIISGAGSINVASGATLTINGPLLQDYEGQVSGAGTITIANDLRRSAVLLPNILKGELSLSASSTTEPAVTIQPAPNSFALGIVNSNGVLIADLDDIGRLQTQGVFFGVGGQFPIYELEVTSSNSELQLTDLTNGVTFAFYNADGSPFVLRRGNLQIGTTGEGIDQINLIIQSVQNQVNPFVQGRAYNGTVLWGISALGEVLASGFATGVATHTANYTLSGLDGTILMNASAGALTATLPAASTLALGREFVIKKIDSSTNAVTIAATTGDTIEGATSIALSSQWAFRRLQVSATTSGAGQWIVTGGGT